MEGLAGRHLSRDLKISKTCKNGVGNVSCVETLRHVSNIYIYIYMFLFLSFFFSVYHYLTIYLYISIYLSIHLRVYIFMCT